MKVRSALAGTVIEPVCKLRDLTWVVNTESSARILRSEGSESASDTKKNSPTMLSETDKRAPLERSPANQLIEGFHLEVSTQRAEVVCAAMAKTAEGKMS